MHPKEMDLPTRASAADPAFAPSRFSARAPWFGGDLQTLRNFIVRPAIDLGGWPSRRIELPMQDGSGDRLVAQLHDPGEQSGGLVVLVHGLTGCEDSFYIRASTRFWLRTGYRVLRLNLRGAGPSRPLCSLQYHAGRSVDLRDALQSLKAVNSSVLDRGLFLVGYSLGGNMLLRFLAEEASAFSVVAAASISAPIDLKAAQTRIMAPRNVVYHSYLLKRMRAEALATPKSLKAEQQKAIMTATSVYDFDDRVIAPANGFSGAADYYRRCSGQRFLQKIALPTLLVHAEDDPWIPSETYRDFDWSQNAALTLALTESGGHVGFHGRDRYTAWYDHEIGRFFARAGQS